MPGPRKKAAKPESAAGEATEAAEPEQAAQEVVDEAVAAVTGALDAVEAVIDDLPKPGGIRPGGVGVQRYSAVPPAEPERVVMTREVAAQLRAPFRKEQIGLLPKPTNKDNPKGNCDVCGKYHGLPAVHLDYVGHAAATDRLLQVDPAWTWRPMSVDANGHPVFDNQGGLWITLTVAGVTRPGYGDQTGGKGSKEIIGDALRNAAMRFGVALDLWSKEDLNAAGDEADAQPVGETGDLRDYDPAVQLIPGAPAGWKNVMEQLQGVDPSMDWQVVLQSALQQGYGVLSIRELGDDEQEAGTRIANATALMISEHPPGEMPPITDTEIQEAFGWAFGGDGSVLVTIPEADPGALGTHAPEPETTDEEPAAE